MSKRVMTVIRISVVVGVTALMMVGSAMAWLVPTN